MQEFTGKTVLITGGSDGIGLAAAKAFGEKGAGVAICGRSKGKLDKAVSILESLKIPVFAECVDVSDAKAYQSFAGRTKEHFGTLDILINNAGYMPHDLLADMELETWNHVLMTNLTPVFVSVGIADRYMCEGGVILNAASFAAVMPSAGLGAYAAAKSGVVSLTRTMAAELGPRGIRAAAYIPGLIETALNEENIRRNGDKLKDPIALGRFGTPEDVAGALVFLASDAASYISGCALEITGGKFAVQNQSAVTL